MTRGLRAVANESEPVDAERSEPCAQNGRWLAGGVGPYGARAGRARRGRHQLAGAVSRVRRAADQHTTRQCSVAVHVPFGSKSGRVVLAMSDVAHPSLVHGRDRVDVDARVVPADEGVNVVRATRFCGRADDGLLPAAEGLPSHDARR